MVSSEGSEPSWPAWPSGAKSQRILEIQVACTPEELFLLLWAPKSPYVAKSQEQLGNKDYKETAWVVDEAELMHGGMGTPPAAPLKAAEYRGRSRMNSCSGSGMGLKYVNEEMQRCVKASDGGPFEVDIVVRTTATYGDRFRPIIKHTIAKSTGNSCTYTVDYALVYIQNTNGLLKKAIERGAINGITKNFQILAEVLGSFKEIGGAAANAEPAPKEKPDTHIDAKPAAAYELPWWSPVLDCSYVRLMEVPAAWLKSTMHVGGAGVDAGSASHAAAALATLLLLVALSVLLFALQAMHASCRQSTGLAGQVCAAVLSAIHLPDTLRSVLCGAALLFLANAFLATLAVRVGPMLESRQAARRMSSMRKSEDGDQPSSGVRYDGYEQALNSAAANIEDSEGALQKQSPQRSRDLARPRKEQIKQNLKGFKNFLDNAFKPAHKPALHRRSGQRSPSPADGSSSRPPSPSPANPTSPPSPAPLASSTTERITGNITSEAESAERRRNILKPSAPKAAQAGKIQPTSPNEEAILSDEDDAAQSQSSFTSQKRASAPGFRERMGNVLNPTALMDKTEIMFAAWSGANKAIKNGSGQDLASRRSADSEYQLSLEGGGDGTSAMELADLSPSKREGTDPVEEEIFENERYQPFRGWGHNWPGHFLPTDRVGHWSIAAWDKQLQPGVDVQSFDAVAPALKPDWEWKEEGWQIDMSGLLENAVDEEGWSYGVDFSWIQWPPPPGAGRFRKVRDYVRRRRWYRTRVHAGVSLEESPQGVAPSLDASATPSMTSLLTEALTRKSAEPEVQATRTSSQGLPPKPRRPALERESAPLPERQSAAQALEAIGQASSLPDIPQLPPPDRSGTPNSLPSQSKHGSALSGVEGREVGSGSSHEGKRDNPTQVAEAPNLQAVSAPTVSMISGSPASEATADVRDETSSVLPTHLNGQDGSARRSLSLSKSAELQFEPDREATDLAHDVEVKPPGTSSEEQAEPLPSAESEPRASVRAEHVRSGGSDGSEAAAASLNGSERAQHIGEGADNNPAAALMALGQQAVNATHSAQPMSGGMPAGRAEQRLLVDKSAQTEARPLAGQASEIVLQGDAETAVGGAVSGQPAGLQGPAVENSAGTGLSGDRVPTGSSTAAVPPVVGQISSTSEEPGKAPASSHAGNGKDVMYAARAAMSNAPAVAKGLKSKFAQGKQAGSGV